MDLVNKEKLKNLLIGTAGIYILYFLSGVIQQYIMKVPYFNSRTQDWQEFKNSNAFILIPSICAWTVGEVHLKIYPAKTGPKIQIPKFNLLCCSFLVLASAMAMTKAIYLTNYPLVMLIKSCNILSVISVALFCSRVKDESQRIQPCKLVIGILFTGGLIVYHFGSTAERFSFEGSSLGVILLFVSVILDGFLPDFQAEIKTKYKPTAMDMFLQTNKWKTVLSLIYAIITLQIKYLLDFFIDHPIALFHMIFLGTIGAFGQIVVYWMITHFKQHVVPFIITTRKLFTVIISILYFKHESTLQQDISLLFIFTLVLYDFGSELTEKKKPSIIKTNQPQKDRLNPQKQESLVKSDQSLVTSSSVMSSQNKKTGKIDLLSDCTKQKIIQPRDLLSEQISSNNSQK